MKKEVTEMKAAPVAAKVTEAKSTAAKVEETKAAVKTEGEVAPKKRGRKSKAEIEALKAAGLYTEKKPAKKTTKKSTSKKSSKTATEKKTNFVIQYFGKELTQQEIVDKVKAGYSAETGKKSANIKELNIYVKPEENAAYYVADGKVAGRVDL